MILCLFSVYLGEKCIFSWRKSHPFPSNLRSSDNCHSNSSTFSTAGILKLFFFTWNHLPENILLSRNFHTKNRILPLFGWRIFCRWLSVFSVFLIFVCFWNIAFGFVIRKYGYISKLHRFDSSSDLCVPNKFFRSRSRKK